MAPMAWGCEASNAKHGRPTDEEAGCCGAQRVARWPRWGIGGPCLAWQGAGATERFSVRIGEPVAAFATQHLEN